MKWLRLILFPFSMVYKLVTLARNKMFDKGILSSKSYTFPIICIGNLSTGGTGKSPMTEYLIRLFKGDYKTATLSRGYGRKTRGYIHVAPSHQAREVGDEPLQFAQKFPEVFIAVCEDRQTGIAEIQSEFGTPEVLILDDAYQHRKVKPGFHILLTAYGDLYVDDYLLPAGNLRESRSGASRADVVVVTKCPKNLSKNEQQRIERRLKLSSNQRLFFSTIQYSETVVSATDSVSLEKLGNKPFVLVTGIANPAPLVQYLKNCELNFEHRGFGDHHTFAQSELDILDKNPVILTTEKDYMRLKGKLKNALLYYLPIQMEFLNGQQDFDHTLKVFVNTTN
ncbi:tetraacyldisaccharide 4'-kinase [Dokdonia sinensis]|uniref:Tetraacyldisaccharide 4'-kinase n=1 Tax=Dokdonia sinensis TaxID=2479847 RepID=A0A3M0GGV6_9FLAO|nr:tetraacyldisaccharide 4'-kinase [Dokdonia sinensis]RMB63904.1 tetraacyldisaccharide 4'-kinase [Dokdonia sinensis]